MVSPHASLDWNPPAPAAGPDRPPGPVDVIVPVYGAAAELAACLASLARHTDLARHRLVLVIDGPQEAAVESALASGVGNETLILRNPARRGFVGSVNRGMGASDRDVVLLNSDTEVTAGWLAKLQEAAYSDPAIATVTPFSNNATIASLPRSIAVNALPAGWSADRFAALVERVAARERPRLPTGIGVCLYIKRKALDRLGLFDEERFGLGYGEESDFCFRALKAGFLNVLDDATFVYHAGQRSFGSTRPGRVESAHRAMRRLHPEYLPTVARFLRADPLRPARERVIGGLKLDGLRGGQGPVRSGGPRRVLHLVHGWPPWNPAGTEVYARRLALRQAAWREVTVYARLADPGRELGEALEIYDGGARVRLVVNNFTQRDPLSRNALYDWRLAADFQALLEEVRPDLLHVHHLAGHAATLPGVAARRRIPILFQIQDWWAPCARANLLDAGRRLCSGPAPAKCSACLPLTGLPPAPLLNRALYASRNRLTQGALRHADAFVMGSQAIHQSYLDLGWLRPEDRTFVIPYGIERPGGTAAGRRPDRPPGTPLRFGVIGSILPHKGIHVAVAAFRGVDPAAATLQVWGDPAVSPAYTAELEALAGPAVRFAGRFDEERRRQVFAGLDALIVPSLGLESFGLVAREALAEGVPVLAARRGALAELFDGAAAPCGALFDPEDPEELRGWIARLAERPEIAAAWAVSPPRVKEMDEHAGEIEEVYERILRLKGGTA